MAHAKEIAGFTILGTLGYGARSTIFQATDRNNRQVALKRVVRHTSADQRFLDQAVLEHEVASKFDHPSLRKSYRIIRKRSLLKTKEIVVVMEMVDGMTLEQARPRSLSQLVRMFQDTAIALGVMHKAGYVHADIKPNNVLITDRDIVKIIDFGQSCPIGTVKERIQGTPDYIAPEQVFRREITPRTDVFNLGATMYWALTGQHVPTLLPRDGKTSRKISSDVAQATPIRQVNPDVPPALASLVMNCIDREPIERPQSMTQVYERLEIAYTQYIAEAKKHSRSGRSAPTEDPYATGSYDPVTGSSLHGHNAVDDDSTDVQDLATGGASTADKQKISDSRKGPPSWDDSIMLWGEDSEEHSSADDSGSGSGTGLPK